MATRKTAAKTPAAKKTAPVKTAKTAKPAKDGGVIRVGIGGWTFEPWRGLFYPKDLVQKRELEYASGKLTSIEINGTFYGSQKPSTFAKWRDETPDDFVFSLKAPRFSTNRRVLSEAGESVERFLASGVLELQDKLGPINWQFATTKQFDPKDFEGFLKLLPAKVEGHPIRHAVEVRHESFRDEAFVALARKYGVAIVMSGDSDYPQIADVTAPFVYARIMGTTEGEAQGYDSAALDLWTKRARDWAQGATPKGLESVAKAAPKDTPRDVYLYVISGFKAHNPAAAMALLERLKSK
ncbi:DUF72 domain-containing protein [Burkholderia sp. PAMC 28687]|uniref:DUF72 domain-containing protein n=1 Tax=Burkholderia sp. PAMC 28687 TaxID=1795874 RepID=UPI0009EA9497|nr:DUF72 domain-containing protein [Burkholderia sp. PAMC 28687]